MFLLCERLRVLPNSGGLMDQTPTNIMRIRILYQARDERARAKEEQQRMKRGDQST